MNKIGLVQQRLGMGDILFTLKVAYRALNEFGCSKVIWPVAPIYNYISEYISQEGVVFEDYRGWIPNSLYIINSPELLYIPLETCDQVCTLQNPRAHGHIKYKFFYNTDYRDWKDYFTLTRNYDRERALVERLGINLKEDYNFINRNFGTPPNSVSHCRINPPNGLKNVYMELLDGVNIFDWLTIAENAKEIHTADTALHYILDKIGLDNVNIYSRYKHFNANDPDDYSHMKDHCNLNWNYV